ncbi:MAG: hypothetical protein Q9182_006871 [Xanthomendoza sp. 2 TL-2023]
MEEYSFDLAKLGEKDSSWTIGKAGERDVEALSSRDEGPEDFTLRMGEWMRGTLLRKKDTDAKGMDSHEENEDDNEIEAGKTLNDNIPLEATEPPQEQEVEDPGQVTHQVDDQDEIQPLSTSTPAPAVLQESNKRSSAPPFARMNTEAMQDCAAQEVFDQICALQAEVERLRTENKDHLSAQRSIQQANLQQQKECRILRTQVDDLKSEVKRLQDSEFKANQKTLRLEQELKKDGSKVGSLRAKFEPVVAELETIKLRAEADKQAADSTINALKADLRSSNDAVSKLQAERLKVASTHNAAIETLKAEFKAEAEACRTKYQHREDILKEQLQSKEISLHSSRETDAKITATEAELEHTKERLEESRRVVQNLEDENDLLVHESERQTEEITSLKRSLDEERLQVASAADAEVAELQEEISRMEAQKVNDTISYSEHTSAVNQLAEDHATATEALTTKHKQELHVLRSAIIKAGEGMKKREVRILAAHNEERSNLQEQIMTLQDQLKTATSPPPQPTVTDDDHNPTVLELRSALQALNARLTTTIADRDENLAWAETYETAHNQLAKKHHRYITYLLKKVDTADAEMEKKVAEKMEEREAEWRREKEGLLEQKREMGDLLMVAWGREECGVAAEGEKQRYRYRFFDREGRYVEGGKKGVWAA